MPEWTVQGAEKAYLELVDEDGDGVELIVGVGRVSHDERRGDSASIVVAMLDAATGRKRAGKGDGRGETRSAAAGGWRIAWWLVMQLLLLRRASPDSTRTWLPGATKSGEQPM